MTTSLHARSEHNDTAPHTYLTDEKYVKWWPSSRAVEYVNVKDGQRFERQSPWLDSLAWWFHKDRPIPEGLQDFYLPEAFNRGPYEVASTLESVDGHWCWQIVLQTQSDSRRVDRIWIDVDYGCVRKRVLENLSEELCHKDVYTCWDFNEVVDGVWLPMRTRHDSVVWRSGNAELQETEVIHTQRIARCEVNSVEDDRFKVDDTLPGTIIYESVPGGRTVIQRIPGGDEMLDSVVENYRPALRRSNENRMLESKQFFSRFDWICVGAAAISVALVLKVGR